MEQVFKAEKYFDPTGSYFGPIIEQHDKYDWLALRKFFAANKEYLAKTVLSFPKDKTPPKFSSVGTTAIEDIFSYTGETDNALFVKNHSGTVFDPWANYWFGMWSNNKHQFHIWDKTISRSGKYLQVVTQTVEETVKAFAEPHNIEDMVKKNQVNLAINVSTEKDGITGWVTKKEKNGATLQMPHLGFLIEASALIWLAKPNPETYDGTWYMFLEWTDSVSNPMRYNIYLNSIDVKSGAIDKKAKIYKGCAKYQKFTLCYDKIEDCDKYTCNP